MAITLNDILLPDTPAKTAKLYRTLPERAKTMSFGLLEEDVVILDTETTGLSFKNSELIEIAAARMNGNQILERFETFVHPGQPIPPDITRLTGITNADVAYAPSPEEAVAQLAEFVDGSMVVAHNATFDRTFIQRVPGGNRVTDLWVDSLALSRIALPCLTNHRLADMAQAFGQDSVSHRAGDDVSALCGMWRIMLTSLCDMPAGLLTRLAELHSEVKWPLRPIFSQLAGIQQGASFDLRAARRDILSATQQETREDAAELLKITGPTNEKIAEEFMPGGTVAKMYPGFEARTEQVAMAQQINEALQSSTHRAIEAGTGVGKSVAYLLPLVMFAQQNNITVGVATKTNALTDQLMAHELPALAKALPQGVSFTALKGYEHYPCLRRLEQSRRQKLPVEQAEDHAPGSYRSDAAIEADMLTAMATVYAYVVQYPAGDLDSLGIRWRSVPRRMLTCSSNDCTRSKCPYFPNLCPVHNSRQQAAASDVVVTNHSLLLRNVAAEGKILPPIRHWVIDEAHGFESEAREQWALEARADTTHVAFEQIGGLKTGAIHALMTELGSNEANGLAIRLLTKAYSAVQRAQKATGTLFDAVRELKDIAPRQSSYDQISMWLGPDERRSEIWGDVASAGLVAAEQLSEAVKCLSEAQNSVNDLINSPSASLAEPTRDLASAAKAIKLVCEGTDESYCYSVSFSRDKRRFGTETLRCEKIDIGSELSARWLPETMSTTFTSATIAVNKDFKHFNHTVGLDLLPEDKYANLLLNSSYDYDNHMQVMVVRDVPQPNDPRYLEKLAQMLIDIHRGMEGSVLTLFTNRREMEQVHSLVAPQLASEGLEVSIQERRSSPRQIRERFLADKKLSLFALRSFWEGFDASGETLRCVVIAKLPFASPNDPLNRERDLREERAWWRYQLPEAVLNVKQAAGRLIRSSSDQGILVLADSRLTTKRYGKQFINSLPSNNVAEVSTEVIPRFIDSWRKTHE